MTTALEGVRGQRHAPAALYPRERSGTHSTGGWVGPSAGMDRCGKFLPTGIRSPDRPARSQSLYRIRYPAHPVEFSQIESNINDPEVVSLNLSLYLTHAARFYRVKPFPSFLTNFCYD
jgi:hypothetical protein